MKKILAFLFLVLYLAQPSFASAGENSFFSKILNSEERAVKKLLKSQLKYANKGNLVKFIATYDEKYTNSDGFNLDTYSSLIKDIWDSYGKLNYELTVKSIEIKGNEATVEAVERTQANLLVEKVYQGDLKSEAKVIYNLRKDSKGKWKVVYDTILEETSTMLYGTARGLDVNLTVPNNIEANTDYTATLEFVPPKETLAIASIACDKVVYPQEKTKEVFRPLPEDNILERIFTSNSEDLNEYIVASIGLTKTSISNMNIRLKLTGFGYAIKRVNVIAAKKGLESKDVDN